MCSYVISEYSTMFTLQLHMQSTSSWCLQVIFLWSAMLAPPTIPRNWSEIVNAGWWLVGVKKLTRGQQADQSHWPYISWCSHQKHHNLPCFGSSNSSVAPSSGKFQNSDMALKQPEIIDVPDDDDFSDSGPQNPVEAQSYRYKLNAIDGDLHQPLGQWSQRCLEVHCHITQEADGQTLVADGQGWHRGSTEVHPWPQLHLPPSAPHHWRSQCDGASDRSAWGVDLPQEAAQKCMEDRSLGAHHDMLWPPLRSACSHVCHFVANMSSLAKITKPRDFQHGHEGGCSTDDSDQHPGALPEVWSKIHPWRRPQKNACPS